MKKNEENLYEISKEEFEQIKIITDEQMEKHPDRAEQILMEFCHIALRNRLITRSDVLILFLKKLDIDSRKLFEKYHIKEDAMFLRNQKEDRICKITRGGKWR